MVIRVSGDPANQTIAQNTGVCLSRLRQHRSQGKRVIGDRHASSGRKMCQMGTPDPMIQSKSRIITNET